MIKTPFAFLLVVCASAAAAQTPQLVVQHGHAAAVRVIVFAPDNRALISGGDDGVRVWDSRSGRLLRNFSTSHAAKSLAVSPDGMRLAVGLDQAGDGTSGPNVELWDLGTGQRLFTLGGDLRPTSAVQFESPQSIVAATGERVLRWDLSTRTETQLARLEGFLNAFTALAPIPQLHLIAAATSAGQIQLIDPAAKTVARSTQAYKGEIAGLAVSPDGKLLASGGARGFKDPDNSVILWDIATGDRVATFESEQRPKPAFGDAEDDITLLAFNTAGDRLAVAGQNRALKIWDVPARRIERIVRENVYGEKLAANADWTAFADTDVSTNAVHMFNAAGAMVRAFQGVAGVSDLAIGGEDNSRIALATASGPVVVNAATWEPITSGGPPGADETARVAFLTANRIVSTGFSSEGAYVLDTETGLTADKICGDASGAALSISKDGKTAALATKDDKGIVLCNLSNGRLGTPFKGGGTNVVTSIEFNPTGDRIVSGGWDKIVRLWTRNGQLVRELRGHMSAVSVVRFSPDGKTIVSAAHNFFADVDTTIRIWDAASGTLLHTLPGHERGVNALAFSGDGKTLASAGDDGAIKVWDVSTGGLLRTLPGVGGAPLVFHPLGWLVVARGGGVVQIVDPMSGAAVLSMTFSDLDWVATTPDGRFDGSSDGWKQVLWRTSNALYDVYPVEVGFREFFTPGLVRDVLSRAPLAPLAHAFSDTDLRRPAVALSLAMPPTGKDVTARTVRVRLDIADGGTGARDVRLFRNGSLVKAWRQDIQFAGGPARLEADVPISAGDNVLTAYAFSRDDVKGDDATLTVAGAKELKRNGELFVLAIGVNTYVDSRFNLKYARADAEAIAAAIKAQNERSTFEAVHVVPLLDTEATRQNILTALSNIAGAPQAGASSLPKLNELHALQPEDVAVVYYAGHGAAIGDRFYLLPHDFSAAGADAAHAIAATSVSDADLENLFVEGTSTGRVVLILDACNSGQALNADDPRRGPMNSRGLGQLAYDKGMYVLAAAQGFQAALETQRLGHGNLTFALLEGLKEVAKSAGKVTFDDTIPAKLVLEYAARRVPELQREDARSKRAALLAAAGTADAVQQPRLFIRDELERQQPLVIGMDQTDLAPGGLILPPLVK